MINHFLTASQRVAWRAGVIFFVFVCAAVPHGTLAATQDKPASASEHIVTIEDMRFTPATLTVNAGDRITWVNKDLVPHTVTSASGLFDSHSIAAGVSWTYTADKQGSYPYVCVFHPGMQGMLMVK